MYFYSAKVDRKQEAEFPLNAAAYLGLTRIENATFDIEVIELSDSISIVHSNQITRGWAAEAKGQECWTPKEVSDYEDSNGGNQWETINAYADSSRENTHSLDYECYWTGSDYYILQQNSIEVDDQRTMTWMQDRFQRERSSAIISLLLLSEQRIRWAPPLEIIKFPQNGSLTPLGVTRIDNPRDLSRGEAKHFDASQIEKLKMVFGHLFDRTHPESYLAALRFYRAHLRREPDDAIVDLMIAFEAMLSGSPEAGIRLRVSHRLSHLLGGSKENRKVIHLVMREAYGFRSHLVHGNKRQSEFLEELMAGESGGKKGKLRTDEVRKVADHLKELLSSAILERYCTHGSTDILDLRNQLDDLAI